MEATAPNPSLLERVRYALAHQRNVSETAVPGGVEFAIDGETFCAVIGDDLLVHKPAGDDSISPDAPQPQIGIAQDIAEAQPIDDEIEGMVKVDPSAIQTAAGLQAQLTRSIADATPVREWPSRAWLQIMFRPRRTLRAMVDADSGRHVFLLWTIAALLGAAANGLGILLDAMEQGYSVPPLGRELFGAIAPNIVGAIVLIAFAAPIAILIGYGIFYLYAAIVTLVGNKLGGVADGLEVRTVLVWSYIPSIIGVAAMVMSLTLLMVMTPYIESSDTNLGLDLVSMAAGIAGFASLLLAVVMQIWTWVIAVVGYSEVNRFSIWRSILGLVAPVVLLILIVFGCVLAFAVASGF